MSEHDRAEQRRNPVHIRLFTGSVPYVMATSSPNEWGSGRPTKCIENMGCGGGHALSCGTWTLLFPSTLMVKVKLNSSQVSHKPGSQCIELNLFSATFDQPVFDFSHPLSDVEFGIFAEEIGGVQFPVKLVDKVCTSEAVAVQ